MNYSSVPLAVFFGLGAASISIAFCGNLAAADVSFKAFIDGRRTLHIEGSDASESILATVSGDPSVAPSRDGSPPAKTGRATITIEYRRGDGRGETKRASFSLDEFDRLVVNARAGDDWVNIVDAGELLENRKKILNLNGGGGENVVVISHLPFKSEASARLKRLAQFSKQLEGIAGRASEATSAALITDATKVIEEVRVKLADGWKALAEDGEKQLLSPARQLFERGGPDLITLGNSFVTRSEQIVKQQTNFAAEIGKKYNPANGVLPPDDDREPAGSDDKSVEPDPEEKDAEAAQAQAEKLVEVALKLGTEAKDQIVRSATQLERDAKAIEEQARRFEERASQLSAEGEGLAAEAEKDLSAASVRVLTVVAEIQSMAKDFGDAGIALQGELRQANSNAAFHPQAKKPAVKTKAAPVKPGASTPAAPIACTSPPVGVHTYVGGDQTDIFFPFAAPSQSWSISGGAGTDILFGGFAADLINGGDGTDFICGLTGDDYIHGDDGTDFLFGEFYIDVPNITGSDCIWGEEGVDLIVGDNLIDTASGVPGGDDHLHGDKGTDFIVGDDVVEAPNFPSLNGASLEIFSQTHLGGVDTIDGNDGVDIIFGDGGGDIIHGNAEIDFVEGNGDGDVIYGDDGRDIQFCNTTIHLGNLLMGGDGVDVVNGGKGIDVIFGNNGGDKLVGGEQIDIMFGGDSGDMMYGDAGGQICTFKKIPIRLGNLMLGGTGDDRMWAGGDGDVMFGESGFDRMYGYDGSGQKPFAVDIDLMWGGDHDDYMQGDDESVILTNSADFMIGGNGADVMDGGSQADLMLGEAGWDTMHGDSNAIQLVGSVDLMFGGTDDDWMDGGNGPDLMFGEMGDDYMLGDNETPGLISSDAMFGGPGSDMMNGGDATDFMMGEEGDDHMLGDSNYWWEPQSNDFMLGGPGADFMDGGHAHDFMFGGPDCDTMLGDNNTPWRYSPDFMVGEGGDDKMEGGNGNDFMWGGDGDDTIVGDPDLGWQLASVDFMWGEGGCDTMRGGASGDWMFGDPGVDQMDGQSGPDMIAGGANTDYISGGTETDVLLGNEGNDLIHGDGFVDLIYGNDGDDCLYGDDDPDLVVGGSGEDCLHGGSHRDLLFGSDGNDLLLGDNGPDILSGGPGDDNLDGGTGADILLGGGGSDEAWGGAGMDLMSAEKRHQSGNSGLDCDCHLESCTGRICVHKFDDQNGDGIQNNNEPGLANWAFTLAASCHGITLITDANGDACADIVAGSYPVVEQLQSGWTPTTPTTQNATITAGATTNLAFGNKRGRGQLCIVKFNDRDSDGIRDDNDLLLPNWSFTVVDADGVGHPLVTQDSGRICTDLPEGTYGVLESTQPGWTPTTATTQTVTVSPNQTTTVFFGNHPGVSGKAP